MSSVFMDGGGHDSIGHGGDGIDHGGHDHASHGMQHGHGQGGHNFLAQILGLDQQDHAHLAHHGGEGAEGQAPSQTPAWNSALQGLKLENLIAGINITPNFLLFMLFASFVGWLGVIYWIRHHEPFANQVLGSSSAFFPAVGADRQLINGCRVANPLKTSAQSGVVYCPQPHQDTSVPAAGSPVNGALSQAMSSPQPAQNTSVPAAGSPINGALSQAMSAAFGQAPSAGAPAQAQSYGATGSTPDRQSFSPATPPASGQTYAASSSSAAAQSYSSQPPASSPINQSLSAAMASALGPTTGQAGQAQGGAGATFANAASATNTQSFSQANGPTGGPTYVPGSTPTYSAAGPSYPMAQQMAAPAQALVGPMTTGLAPGGTMPDAGGMRLFSSRRSMMAQAQPVNPQNSPAPVPSYAPSAPAPPAVSANTWSLANQGNGTFSADTAQFNSQFGAPLDTASTIASPPGKDLSVSGANPPSTVEASGQKVDSGR